MCLLAISQAADSIGQSRDYGVLKGFIGVSATGDGGFWMTHSIEKYPDLARGAQYGYFPAKEQAGHSILCVSLSMAQLNELSHTVSATRPNVRQPSERACALSRLPHNCVQESSDVIAWARCDCSSMERPLTPAGYLERYPGSCARSAQSQRQAAEAPTPCFTPSPRSAAISLTCMPKRTPG